MKGVTLANSERSNSDREVAYNNWLSTLKTPDGQHWVRGFKIPDVATLLEIRSSVKRVLPWLQRISSGETAPSSPVCTFEEVSRLAMVQRLGPGSHSPALRAGIKAIATQDLQIHQAKAVVIAGQFGPEWLKVIGPDDELPGPNSGTIGVINREHIMALSERAVELALPTVLLPSPLPEQSVVNAQSTPVDQDADIKSAASSEGGSRLVLRDLRLNVRCYIEAGNDWAELVQRAGVPNDLTGSMFQLLVGKELPTRRLNGLIVRIKNDPFGIPSLRQMARILDLQFSQSTTDQAE